MTCRTGLDTLTSRAFGRNSDSPRKVRLVAESSMPYAYHDKTTMKQYIVNRRPHAATHRY